MFFGLPGVSGHRFFRSSCKKKFFLLICLVEMLLLTPSEFKTQWSAVMRRRAWLKPSRELVEVPVFLVLLLFELSCGKSGFSSFFFRQRVFLVIRIEIIYILALDLILQYKFFSQRFRLFLLTFFLILIQCFNCFEIKRIELKNVYQDLLKGALSGLKQFLATENPLKMMKKAFYFTSNVLFILKIFKFSSWLSGHVSKRLD